MVTEGQGFFRTVLQAFWDFPSYGERAEEGARSAFKFLLKLALLAGAIGVVIVLAYQRHHFRTVVQPKIDEVVKPAFEGSPALSWKEGTLTADGTVPFRATVELDEQRMTMIVDSGDDPDTGPLRDEAGDVVILGATHLYQARDGKDSGAQEYGKRFDGLTLPAGAAYQFFPRFRGPRFDLVSSLMLAALLGAYLLFLMAAATVIVSGVCVALVPEGRRLGLGGLWSVGVHAMAPAVAVLLVTGAALLFSGQLEAGASGLWVLWALPLVVALAVTYLGVRASIREVPSVKPGLRKPVEPPRDDDLLPPDKV